MPNEPKGPASRLWKGMETGYFAKHVWLKKNYSHLKVVCEDCEVTEKLEFANISGKHFRDVSDYRILCRSCHRKYDNAKSGLCAKEKHAMTEDNVYTYNGWKNCRQCRKEASIRQKEKNLG